MPVVSPRERIGSIIPFPGGMATRVSELISNKWKVLENWWMDPKSFGSITVWPGFDRVNSSAILDSAGANFDIFTIGYGESSGLVRKKFVCGGDEAHTLADDGASSLLKDNLTADQRFSIITYNDLVLFFNGADNPFKYDFSTVSDIGLTRPDVSLTTSAIDSAASDTDKNVKGIVQYFVSFISDTTEGALSEAFGEIDAGGGNAITLSSIPTGGGGVTARKIYRTFRDDVFPFVVDTIEDNTTTTFTDTFKDSDLGNLADKFGEPPPPAAYAISHFNRIWIAGMSDFPNQVWWSDRFEPESYFPENIVNIFKEDGDQITGLSRDRDGIFVFKEHHVYKIIGRDPEVETLIVNEVTRSDQNNRNIGCPAHWSISSTPLGHFFYYDKGFYRMGSDCSIEYISGDIQNELREDINQSSDNTINSVYDATHRVVYFSVPTGVSTAPDRTYGYFIDTGDWFRISEGFNSMVVVEKGTDGSRPDSFEIWASQPANNALVYELLQEDVFTFDGSTIVATATLPTLSGSSSGRLSRWLWLMLMYDVEPTGTIDVIYKLDTEPTGTTVSFPLTGSNVRDREKVNIGLMANECEFTFKFNGGSYRPRLYGFDLNVEDMGAHI